MDHIPSNDCPSLTSSQNNEHPLSSTAPQTAQPIRTSNEKMSVQNFICNPSLPPLPPPFPHSPKQPSTITPSQSRPNSSIPIRFYKIFSNMLPSQRCTPASEAESTAPPRPSLRNNPQKTTSPLSCARSQTSSQPNLRSPAHTQPVTESERIETQPNHSLQPERSTCIPSEHRKSYTDDSSISKSALVPDPYVHTPRAKRPWTSQEDRLLRSLVEKHGERDWAAIAEEIPHRTGKQVRERYLNYLSPKISQRPFSKQEDEIIIEKHRVLGNRWSRIAKFLNGRSDNSVKNRFYVTLKKRIEASRDSRQLGKRSRPEQKKQDDQTEEPIQPTKQRRVWE
ncbi:Transcription factor MYB44 [Gracilariopsis chorda]|uniref:Transcription factor MYB44 n=1 Tax=Gracilariopsis chorda TaxID=448386 RepID=A0A2V3IP67_9FLOR|nr:Transcription factor MYB44 [Gracilariopsis chorda]|eukprot:PXF42920.1 Transcription factor MYB44 [Gracilariopsis chorda]